MQRDELSNVNLTCPNMQGTLRWLRIHGFDPFYAADGSDPTQDAWPHVMLYAKDGELLKETRDLYVILAEIGAPSGKLTANGPQGGVVISGAYDPQREIAWVDVAGLCDRVLMQTLMAQAAHYFVPEK